MTNALSRAIEKAMETDVEYRRGLPVQTSSFMGTGIVSIGVFLNHLLSFDCSVGL